MNVSDTLYLGFDGPVRKGTELYWEDKESEDNGYLILQEIFHVCVFNNRDTKGKEKYCNDF